MDVARSTTHGPTEEYRDRLERLDALDARDARDARERCEAADAADARRTRLEALEAAEAKDEIAAARALLDVLVRECGQEHLVSDRPSRAPYPPSKDELRLLTQLLALERSVAGGVAGYVARARKLLGDSRLGRDSLAGYTPSVPTGLTLEFGGAEFLEYEAEGAAAMGSAAFVLVAGGLGERLGFSGIKLELPTELVTGTTYLALYASHILALGKAVGKPRGLPLVLMTSDDTDAKTRAVLQRHGHFGLDPALVTLLKQQAVPCLRSADADLALDPADRSRLLTKPGGHGEVHRLLHSSGVAAKLRAGGATHLLFFQDTNALVFHALPAALGVSRRRGLALNFVSVRRRAGDASGALLQLTSRDAGRAVLANVEYNQLEPMLRAASGGATGDDPDPATGWSPYPGNCNQLVVALEPYLCALKESGGKVPEFVNPKYTDSSRGAFKSPTRLESMLQDLPWLLLASEPVGFTAMDGALSYAPTKNSLADGRVAAAAGRSPACAASAELALYAAHAHLLRLAGAHLPPAETVSLAGVAGLPAGPKVVLTPSFRPTVGAALARLRGGGDISLSPRSALVTVLSLSLDGALRVRAAPGARVTIANLTVVNEGWALRELSAAEAATAPEVLRLRGFALDVLNERVLTFDAPGDYVVDE